MVATFGAIPSESLTKRRFRDGRYSQPRASLLWIDFHRLCLRQDQGLAGIRPRLDELFPVVRFSTGVAVPYPVGHTIFRTEQPAIPARNHAGDRERLRPCHGGGPDHRRFVAA